MQDASGPPKPYHHGNLTEALIAAVVSIIEERGMEHVSVREAARRAGVSSGAPFRHFASRAALIHAVAEQAMGSLAANVRAALTSRANESPARRIEAIGLAYLDWALGKPTHFQVVSSRVIAEFRDQSTILEQNNAIRDVMASLFREMKAAGSLAPDADIDVLILSCRAHVYGLARMAVDGHFPEWHPGQPLREASAESLRICLQGLIGPY